MTFNIPGGKNDEQPPRTLCVYGFSFSFVASELFE